MSAFGPNQTFRECFAMSAFGGIADIARVGAKCPVLSQNGSRRLHFVVMQIWTNKHVTWTNGHSS
jgi:hypothetical protein